MSKKKILILTDWYLPSVKAGGPVRSVSAIVDRLKSNFEISILTSDRDIGDESQFDSIQCDTWVDLGGYMVKYISPANRRSTLAEEVSRPDYHKIYLNSLFSSDFTIFVLRTIKADQKKKIILAPRGMLGKGALSIKPFKKCLFLTISSISGLYRGITWHASTDLEKAEILAKFPKANVKALINLPACKKEPFQDLDKKESEFRLCFASRISKKKNLLFAIHAIKSSSLRLILDVYGPIEDEPYWNQCLSIGKGIVNYCGVLDHSELTQTLSTYHFMIFPTTHENFGHIVLECLNSSTPVIISDQTPWKDLDEHKAGFVVPLELEKWVSLLKSLFKLESNQYHSLRRGAYDRALSELDRPLLIEEYVHLFS